MAGSLVGYGGRSAGTLWQLLQGSAEKGEPVALGFQPRGAFIQQFSGGFALQRVFAGDIVGHQPQPGGKGVEQGLQFAKIVGRGHKAPRSDLGLGTKKGKATLPGSLQPPVLADTGRRLANMYSTPSRCADGKTKKTALFTVWGTAKATVTPVVI